MEKINRNILIDFEPIARRIHYQENKSIYDLIMSLNIPIKSICGGIGSCGKCRLLIQKGIEYFNSPTDSEYKFLSVEDFKNGWRLACQAKINHKHINILESLKKPQFRIFLPEDLILEDFNILTFGTNKGFDLNPAVKKIYLEVKKPSLYEPVPDFERILSSMDSIYKKGKKKLRLDINLDLLEVLPTILRENNYRITLALWNHKEVIAFESGNTTEKNFGIAFDIGTTSIVGYLINLNDGKIYSVSSKLNSQTAYGEDVITRITFIKDNKDGLKKLNSAVLKDLNEIITKVCNKIQINTSQIYEATVVGNSVMHHIFLGLNPINIGLSPFIPVIRKAMNLPALNLNLNINPNGKVYTAPLIAGFVGADTIGVILASGIDQEKELTLAIDIGTNGEIIIGNNHLLAAGSCAAGSALEGAHISDGMRAAAGAIDKVSIDPKNFEVTYTTIKNKSPIGLCGSGLVDTIAEMLKSKIITRSGNFNKELINKNILFKNDNQLEFILVKKEDTKIGREIKITQNDIRQIQMAKAAFYSGFRVLLKYLNNKSSVKQVFLAGAFGNYIDKTHAKFIGMIPDIPNEKIHQIGNAAGIGAQLLLLNKDFREKANKLLMNIQYIEIATTKEFQKEYIDAMYFPHLNLNNFPSVREYETIPLR